MVIKTNWFNIKNGILFQGFEMNDLYLIDMYIFRDKESISNQIDILSKFFQFYNKNDEHLKENIFHIKEKISDVNFWENISKIYIRRIEVYKTLQSEYDRLNELLKLL
jgi:hypothetical protein